MGGVMQHIHGQQHRQKQKGEIRRRKAPQLTGTDGQPIRSGGQQGQQDAFQIMSGVTETMFRMAGQILLGSLSQFAAERGIGRRPEAHRRQCRPGFLRDTHRSSPA